jgi:RNA polymerase sigma-70 factor, ECF subfamily
LRRSEHPTQPLDTEAVLELAVELSDPDLAKRQIRHELRLALREAVAALSERERTVLRLNFLEGLTIDDIGQLYRVHRATVARWIAAARESVRHRTQAALRRDLNLLTAEVDSLLKLADDCIDLSLSAIL